jgi:hypothetical protein
LFLTTTFLPDFICKLIFIEFPTVFENNSIVCVMLLLIGLIFEFSDVIELKYFKYGLLGLNAGYIFIPLLQLSSLYFHDNRTDQFYSKEIRWKQYWSFNLISCFCFLLTFLSGTFRRNLQFLRGISVVFWSLYLLEKIFEFPWKDETYALMLFFTCSISIVSIILLKRTGYKGGFNSEE